MRNFPKAAGCGKQPAQPLFFIMKGGRKRVESQQETHFVKGGHSALITINTLTSLKSRATTVDGVLSSRLLYPSTKSEKVQDLKCTSIKRKNDIFLPLMTQ